MRSSRLTRRQEEVLAFVRRRCREGRPPSLREVAAELSMHFSRAKQHADALLLKGWLVRDADRSRTLRPVRFDGLPVLNLEDCRVTRRAS